MVVLVVAVGRCIGVAVAESNRFLNIFHRVLSLEALASVSSFSRWISSVFRWVLRVFF